MTENSEVPARIQNLRDQIPPVEPGRVAPYVSLFDELAREDLADSGLNVYHMRDAQSVA